MSRTFHESARRPTGAPDAHRKVVSTFVTARPKMKAAFRCDTMNAVKNAPVEVCKVRYRSLRVPVARQNRINPLTTWNSIKVTSTGWTKSERYHFRSEIIIALLSSKLNTALAWFRICQARKMSTISNAEVPCANLSGMGLGVEEAGVSVPCLRIDHAAAARTVSHRIDQNTVSPLAECSRKNATPISTKSGGEATAKCAIRRASN